MRLVQCEHKHFFDADKFSECPYCGRKNEAPLTEAIVPRDDQETTDREETDHNVIKENKEPAESGVHTPTEIYDEETFCPNCGIAVEPDENYCWKCGAILSGNVDTGSGERKMRWKISLPLLIPAVVLLVFLIIFFSVFFLREKKAKEEKEQLERAASFAELQDYEHAISAFLSVLDLNDKSVEAYLGLADVYVLQGETKSAKKILADGEEKTGSPKIREALKNINIESAKREDSTENTITDIETENDMDKNAADEEPADDWRTAYIKIANDALEFDLANYEEEPKFAFVYLDDDDIPELFVGCMYVECNGFYSWHDGKVIDLAAPFVEHVIEPYTLLMEEAYGGDSVYAYHAPEGLKQNELLWFDCIPGSGKYHISSEPTSMSGTYYYSHGDIIPIYEPTQEAVIRQYKRMHEGVYEDEIDGEAEPQDVWFWGEQGHLTLYTNSVTLSYQDVMDQLQ